MTIKTVGVLGGAGFVGSSIVAKLDAAGYRVRVFTRHRERAKHLILLPNVDVVECEIGNHHALSNAVKGCDAVINLIGILHETSRDSFELVHHQIPRRLVQICEELGIGRLIHMSALRAGKYAPSKYLRSKAAGEDAVNEFSKKLDITIFKPSVIFGRNDAFLNMFATVVRYAPMMVLGMSKAKFQPVWVEDVATAFVRALENPQTYGKTYELAGPKVYTLRELVEFVMATLGKSRPIIGLGNSLSMLEGFCLELMPGKLMTRDNVRSMKVDSVLTEPLSSDLGLNGMPPEMAAMEVIVPTYLNNETMRANYDKMRSAAGRAINARR